MDFLRLSLILCFSSFASFDNAFATLSPVQKRSSFTFSYGATRYTESPQIEESHFFFFAQWYSIYLSALWQKTALSVSEQNYQRQQIDTELGVATNRLSAGILFNPNGIPYGLQSLFFLEDQWTLGAQFYLHASPRFLSQKTNFAGTWQVAWLRLYSLQFQWESPALFYQKLHLSSVPQENLWSAGWSLKVWHFLFEITRVQPKNLFHPRWKSAIKIAF